MSDELTKEEIDDLVMWMDRYRKQVLDEQPTDREYESKKRDRIESIRRKLLRMRTGAPSE